MKKNKDNKKHKGKSNKKPSLPNDSLISSIYYGFGVSGLRGYIQLFVAVFVVLFIGYHLIEAINYSYVWNLRVPNKVFLNESPIWFIFVISFKVLLMLLSLGYIIFYIKSRLNKNA